MILLVKCICLLVIQRFQLVPPSPRARSWFIDSTTYRYLQIIKGSLGGETSVLRTFRMSGKELVKETVSQRNS